MKLGVSPHRFSGWEPEVRTRYEYDDTGRLIRSVQTKDPEWDELDRAILAVYIDYQSSICECGFPFDEALHDPSKQDQQRYRGQYFICNACMAKERAEWVKQKKESGDKFEDTDFRPTGESLKWRVRRLGDNEK